MDELEVLKKLFYRIQRMPSLPSIVFQVLRLLEDEDVSIKELQEAIKQDPSLTLKILKMANSAYYGLPRKISTVSEALVILGLETLKSIVIAASAYHVLGIKVSGYRYPHGGLWVHSLYTATVAQEIARYVGLKNTEEIFIAALLHDVGKIALGEEIEAHEPEMIEVLSRTQASFEMVEKAVIGINHAEAGAMVVKVWNLPSIYQDTIGFHHYPSAADKYKEMIACVHLADIIAIEAGTSSGWDGIFYKIDRSALEILSLSERKLDVFLAATVSKINELWELVSAFEE